MTTTKTDLELAGVIFAAIHKALQDEGFDKQESYRLAARGACLLAVPETPELEAALRAADKSRLPLKITTAFDGLDRSLRQTPWLLGGFYVYLLA